MQIKNNVLLKHNDTFTNKDTNQNTNNNNKQ